jgi:NAD(P)-dependent dehydrogenase (short-subunit alcohol dehydrogenase family)
MARILQVLIVVVAVIAVLLAAVRERNIRGSAMWLADVPTADLSVDMRGKTVVVTGANSGIGVQMSAAFKAMGASVIMVCRSIERGEAALPVVAKLAGDLQLTRQAHGGGSAQVRRMDLASFKSIDAFVEQLVDDGVQVDVLVNNAALANNNDFETEDKLQVVMGVNHFGVFRLTLAMLNAGLIHANEAARIVIVSSDAHHYSQLTLDDVQGRTLSGVVGGFGAYASSKMANLLFAERLAERLAESGITVNALHPGFIATNLMGNARGIVRFVAEWMTNLMAMDSWQGAQNSIHLATSPALSNVSGTYFVHFDPTDPIVPDNVDEFKQSLWRQSVELTNIDLQI